MSSIVRNIAITSPGSFTNVTLNEDCHGSRRSMNLPSSFVGEANACSPSASPTSTPAHGIPYQQGPPRTHLPPESIWFCHICISNGCFTGPMLLSVHVACYECDHERCRACTVERCSADQADPAVVANISP